MKPEEYRDEAYRLGHRFARGLLDTGQTPDTVRLAMDRAQERLLELRAYSADLEAMMRRGAEDALVTRPAEGAGRVRQGRIAARISRMPPTWTIA